MTHFLENIIAETNKALLFIFFKVNENDIWVFKPEQNLTLEPRPFANFETTPMIHQHQTTTKNSKGFYVCLVLNFSMEFGNLEREKVERTM